MSNKSYEQLLRISHTVILFVIPRNFIIYQILIYVHIYTFYHYTRMYICEQLNRHYNGRHVVRRN